MRGGRPQQLDIFFLELTENLFGGRAQSPAKVKMYPAPKEAPIEACFAQLPAHIDECPSVRTRALCKLLQFIDGLAEIRMRALQGLEQEERLCTF